MSESQARAARVCCYDPGRPAAPFTAVPHRWKHSCLNRRRRVAEIGDKTQLLALLLAARFRKPVPIILGIFVATLANHAMAGAVGAWSRHSSADGDAMDPWAAPSSRWRRWMLVPTSWTRTSPSSARRPGSA